MDYTDDLMEAIKEFRKKLPGWWFTVGYCELSCDASCGPDFRTNVDRDVLKKFDSGFHADLHNPSTLADALRDVMNQALEALKEFHRSKDG